MTTLSKQLSSYILDVQTRIEDRKKKLGLIDRRASYATVEDQAKHLTDRAWKFVQDSNEMCDIWHSKECTEDRNAEHKYYGKVRVYKVKCIDGRKPRGFEGEADSLKTEKGQISVDLVESDGQLVPRQSEICNALSDVTVEPLEISLAHYDSHDPNHGCAAIKIALDNLSDPNEEEVWKYLTTDERDLVVSARARSLEYANLVLLELTNSRAFDNFHNDVRLAKGVKPLKKVGITALFDTRTMGMELRSPLLSTDRKTGRQKLTEEKDIKILSTTPLANLLKDAKLPKLPAFAEYLNDFANHAKFKDYSRALTKLTQTLFESKSIEVVKVRETIQKYLDKHLSDLTKDQSKALMYRLLRSISHQYLTGLSEFREHHNFADHDERYISVSEDADYPGKYIIEYQTFRMSSPDPKTGAKRVDIAALVMDKTDVDKGAPHILFISSTVKSDNRDLVISKNTQLFRSLIREKKIAKRVSEGNLLPVGILVNKEGKIVEIVTQNALFI